MFVTHNFGQKGGEGGAQTKGARSFFYDLIGLKHIFLDIDIRENNLLRTIPSLGPEYRISLEVFVNSFTVPNMQDGYYADILHFTSTDGTCCNVGGRIPSIFTKKGNKISVCTQIGTNGNYYNSFDFVKEKWIKLEIQQNYIGGGEVIKFKNLAYVAMKFSFSLCMKCS